MDVSFMRPWTPWAAMIVPFLICGMADLLSVVYQECGVTYNCALFSEHRINHKKEREILAATLT